MGSGAVRGIPMAHMIMRGSDMTNRDYKRHTNTAMHGCLLALPRHLTRLAVAMSRCKSVSSCDVALQVSQQLRCRAASHKSFHNITKTFQTNEERNIQDHHQLRHHSAHSHNLRILCTELHVSHVSAHPACAKKSVSAHGQRQPTSPTLNMKI